jgi:hypothetical protein
MTFKFTYFKLKEYFEQVLSNNYQVITCADYWEYKKRGFTNRLFINRVDIDVSCRQAKRIAVIFNELNIKASFFVRLHANEYNPFSFEEYKCLKYIRDTGHEIGYHSEVIDQATIWNEDAEDCLRRDIKVLNTMLDIEVKGVASHGGITGLNNLDFWKDRKASDFGLCYEAYDKQPEFNLFNESLYVSDANYRWKNYMNGVLQQGDNRTLGELAACGAPVIYSTIHPDTYYYEHIYE